MNLMPAPKDPIANARYRRAILERCAEDEEFRRECWIRASRDIVWFCDVFGWTYSPKDYPDCPERPFILYEYQEKHLHRMNDAVGKHDILVEKSRDMGASWLCILLFTWRFLFFRRQSFLVGSRKMEYVDKTGDPKALFWKIMFIIENLPGWMQPNITRNAAHLHNHDNNSTIDGESTNENFATGDRRTAVLLDEFAKVQTGYSILSATRDVTKTRLFNSTPQGASGAYYDTRRKMESTNPERIVRMHWSEHPEKAAGLYTTKDNQEGGELVILDTSYQYPDDYKFVLDGKLRSPWYDEECNRAANQQEIAQELDIDYAASGWQYFDPRFLDSYEKQFAQKPLVVGELDFDGDGRNPEWMDQPGARMQLWFKPDVGGKPPPGQYTVGCDVATGKGGEMSSNSVASVVNKLTGEKVAQFTTNMMSPPDFCRYVMAICRWFHDAYLIWEENGPGGEFTKQLKESGYRNVFYREDEKAFVRRKSRKAGWWSNKETKRLLLSDLFQAMKAGTFVNRCQEAIRECGEYVHHPDGTIVHARSENTIDPTAAGENHGDMVIADALAHRGCMDSPATSEVEEPEPPPNSFLARRIESQRAKRSTDVYFRERGRRSFTVALAPPATDLAT